MNTPTYTILIHYSEIGLKKAEPKVYGLQSVWNARVKSWQRDGSWMKNKWGEDPEHENTDVPIHILKELKVGKFKQCSN